MKILKYAKFNGEYGFDEPNIPMPPNVTETYDIEDDDEEEDIVCDPRVDYECDGDTLDNFDGWEYDESSIDVFELKEKLEKCTSDFEDLKLLYSAMSETITNQETLGLIDMLIEQISKDLYEINVYIGDPMIYSGDIDMHVMIDTLNNSGTIPNIMYLKTELNSTKN